MVIHMSTEKLDTQVRQEQIVRAALTIVAAEGLDRLSVARVARRVGVVPSALYRHFGSKDEIIDAVLASVLQGLAEGPSQARVEAPDAPGRLRALLGRQLGLISRNPGVARLLFSDEAYRGRPERRARMNEAARRYLESIAELIREGQGNGEVDPAVDPASAALLFLGLVQSPAMLALLSAGEFNLDAWSETGWTLFGRLLGSAPQVTGRYVNVDSLLL